MKEYYVEADSRNMKNLGLDYFYITATGMSISTAEAHIHEAIEIIYIVKGRFDFFINSQKYQAGVGSLFMFRPNTIHNIFSASDGENAYYVLKITTSCLFDMVGPEKGIMYLMNLGVHSENKKFLWNPKETEKFVPYINSFFAEIKSQSYGYELVLKSNATLLIALLLRDAYNQDDSINKNVVNYSAMQKIYSAMTYINSHYFEDISVNDASNVAGMNYTYFSRLFKQVMGKSFTSYLNELRINHAEKELLLTDKSVTEIAYSCGFNDTSYFISQYRKLKGRTPYQFRKKA